MAVLVCMSREHTGQAKTTVAGVDRQGNAFFAHGYTAKGIKSRPLTSSPVFRSNLSERRKHDHKHNWNSNAITAFPQNTSHHASSYHAFQAILVTINKHCSLNWTLAFTEQTHCGWCFIWRNVVRQDECHCHSTAMQPAPAFEKLGTWHIAHTCIHDWIAD